MEARDFIQTGLDRVKQAKMRTVDGSSHYELMLHPGPEANSMGIILSMWRVRGHICANSDSGETSGMGIG